MTASETTHLFVAAARKIWFLCIAATIASTFAVASVAETGERGVERVEELFHGAPGVGVYRALVIGINDYEDPAIPDLKTAANDAKAMADVLEVLYGFQVTLILDRQAKRETIYNALREISAESGSNDSFLIYYAGHGELDRQYNDGWWVPYDARYGKPLTFLENVQVQKAMANTHARHVLLISDSCYAGTLFGDTTRELPPMITEKYYLDLYQDPSRWGITSGNRTRVTDAYDRSSMHSLFADEMLKVLCRNPNPYLDTLEIFTRIAPIIANNAPQKPMCLPIKNTGDRGGGFVFIRNDGTFPSSCMDYGQPDLDEAEQIPNPPSPKPSPQQTYPPITNSLRMKFVYIPPGEFLMGSPPDELGRSLREVQHRVTLTRGLYMQTTEVTQGQWMALMGNNPSTFRNCGEECPVENVSWNDAKAFIRRLNEREGETVYRLPTKAESEYACRAGSKSALANGPLTELGCGHDPNLDKIGWYCGNAQGKPHPVGLKAPNAWGVYDMHGNVWEWLADVVKIPGDPLDNSLRVFRGGSWAEPARGCRAASCYLWNPDGRGDGLGFRLSRSLR